ncbi:MAG: YCF48-related protein [Patescibacteria group bacterium]|jgi:photosystem II stability/assembly factor-like uncharacterized protein
MQKTKFFITILLAAIALSGCSISVNSKDTSNIDGGIFVSSNKGEIWGQTASVPTTNGVESIRSFDSAVLVFDPSDAKAVYLGTVGQGLYYSYDLSRGWQKAYTLPSGTVLAVAVSPDDKCQIYATLGNKLYASKDCNRTYEQIYFDNDPVVQVSSLAIDYYDPNKIYIGTSKGDILKSSDRGQSWQTIYRTGFRVWKIILDSVDSRIIFASTNGAGLFRSVDGGENWVSLKESLKEFKDSNKIIDVSFATLEKGLIFAATASGIMKSTDNGDSWTKIELITKENQKESSVETMAVNPKNAQEIYYATKTTFYSSVDGGVSWKTKKLPSTRAGAVLMVKPDQPNVLFLGLKKINSSGQY